MGVTAEEFTPEAAAAMGLDPTPGAVVVAVQPGSPADQAGLVAADVVIAVDGRPLRSGADLRNQVGLLRIGQSARLSVIRDLEVIEIEILVARPKATERSEAGEEIEGIAGAFFAAIPDSWPNHGRVDGVAVIAVDRNSRAEKLGLRPGDVILTLAGKPTLSPAQLEEAAAAAPCRRPLRRAARRSAPLRDGPGLTPVRDTRWRPALEREHESDQGRAVRFGHRSESLARGHALAAMPQDRLGHAPRAAVMQQPIMAIDRLDQAEAPERRSPPFPAIGQIVGAAIGQTLTLPGWATARAAARSW